METGHVETPSRRLTDAQQFLNVLPVQSHSHPAQSVIDMLTEESESGMPQSQGVWVQSFMTGITWTMFALALGVLVWMTVAAGKEYLAH